MLFTFLLDSVKRRQKLTTSMKKRFNNDFPYNDLTHLNESDTEHIVKKDSDTLEYVKSLSDDIFKAKKGERIKTVLTIGKDCIGKTFHAQKFTSEWARHETSITNRFFKFISWKEQDAEIVFHLTSAQLSKSKKISLVGLLNDVFTETQQFVISDFEKYKLIIVLDGLDGLPLDFDDNVEPLRDVREVAPVSRLLSNLIMGNLLPSAHLWILSRPLEAKEIPSKFINKQTEIRGKQLDVNAD